MKRSLFEMLGNADQERIHTQIIAWLLTPADSPLNSCKRAKVINTAFLPNEIVTPQDANNATVVTELNRLDFVVLIPPYNLIAVENKLKSRQGTDQLQTYDIEIQQLKKDIAWAGKNDSKILLTFSGEQAEGEWKSIDYQKIYDALYPFRHFNAYLLDYTNLLKALLNSRKTFLSEHARHQEIFARSGMKISERLRQPLKSEASSIEKFVCSNRLERLFVETLFRKVSSKVKSGHGKDWVAESRGKALIHVELFHVTLTNACHEFICAFQFQGDSIKLNIQAAEDKNQSKSEWLTGSHNEFDEIMNCVAPGTKPYKDRGRAYRSWIRRLNDSEHPKIMSFQEFVYWLDSEVDCAKAIWQNALDQLKHKNIVRKFKAIC